MTDKRGVRVALFAIAIAVALTGCQRPKVKDQEETRRVREYATFEYSYGLEVHRIIDDELGVVCYIKIRGLDCLRLEPNSNSHRLRSHRIEKPEIIK